MILEIFQQALSPANQALKRPLSFEENLFYSFLSHLILATILQMHVAGVGIFWGRVFHVFSSSNLTSSLVLS